MVYDKLIGLDIMISDLEIIEAEHGPNYPVISRSNGHFSKLKVCFITNTLKDLPDNKGAYSAGYLYDMKTITSLMILINTLRIARCNGYQLKGERNKIELNNGSVVIYGDISVQKDCKSKE